MSEDLQSNLEEIDIKSIKAKIASGVKATKGLTFDVQTWMDKAHEDVPVIPTPSARINAALGIGGVPLGRIVEIFGSESAGKTTIALHIVAEAQKAGLVASYIDMEHALDARYAQSLGIDMERLLVSQPDTGDDALNGAKVLLESGVKLIVIDSVPSLVSKDELQKDVTAPSVGLIARVLSQGCRQLSPLVSEKGACLIFINQIREKVGVMYGNPETTPGGRALKHYSSMRLRLNAIGQPTETRRTTKIKVVKNKLAAPFKECEVDLVFGRGIDEVTDLIRFGKELGVIRQGGPYYSLPINIDCPGMEEGITELKFRGEEETRNFIENTEGYLRGLRSLLQKTYRETNG